MCTLLLGVGVLGHGTLLVGANRDEDPRRPSDPPMALSAHPLVAGGRDRVSGGTWLAVRGRDAVIAVLNRRAEPPQPPLRSRGLLALEVAVADDPMRALHQATAGQAYGPWSLVHADRSGGWVARGGDAAGRGVTRVIPLARGWHVLTHTQLDDPAEPRAAWLAHELADARPRDPDAGLALLARLLATHGGDGVPAVCLHGGRMPTRSSARIWLGPDGARWWHAEGPPCVTPWRDVTSLLAAESAR
jgi:transport and Golgi organization protein 2